jgi:hypothetical protein
MGRIDTKLVVAEMVNLEAFGNWASREFIGKTMGDLATPGLEGCPVSPICVLGEAWRSASAGRPQPAAIVRFYDLNMAAKSGRKPSYT